MYSIVHHWAHCTTSCKAVCLNIQTKNLHIEEGSKIDYILRMCSDSEVPVEMSAEGAVEKTSSLFNEVKWNVPHTFISKVSFL